MMNSARFRRFQNLATLVLVVLLIALVGLGELVEGTLLPLAMVVLGLLLVGMLAFRMLLAVPRGRDFAMRLPLPDRVSTHLLSFMTQLKPAQMLLMTLAYAISWTVIGLAFLVLVTAVQPDIDSGDWLNFAGLFAGAWVIPCHSWSLLWPGYYGPSRR